MSKREKISPVSILLRTSAQVQTVENKLRNVPLDEDNPIEVLFREKPKDRGIDQHRYYHLRIGEIADQAWVDGKQFHHDTWHEHCKWYVMPEEITTRTGEVRSKWIDQPDGSVRPISTTQLEKKCFADYTTMVEAFGASLGVHFSEFRR